MQRGVSALDTRGSDGLFLETARLRGEARYTDGNGAREPQLRGRGKGLRELPARTEIVRSYPNEERQPID
jgi:hypothetical protein